MFGGNWVHGLRAAIAYKETLTLCQEGEGELSQVLTRLEGHGAVDVSSWEGFQIQRGG